MDNSIFANLKYKNSCYFTNFKEFPVKIKNQFIKITVN